MPDSDGSFLMRWAGDVLFFSGDVKTTTIALAITSSLCCSIVYWIAHVIGGADGLKPKPAEDHLHTRRRLSSGKSPVGVAPRPVRVSAKAASSPPYTTCSKCFTRSAHRGCSSTLCSECCQSTTCNYNITKAEHDLDKQKKKPKEVNLSYAGLNTWPERLGFIGAQLTRLDLSHNHLTSLPDEIGCLLGLQELDLQCNNLTYIPDSIRNLSKLKELDLSGNCLAKLPDVLSSFKHLVRLNVGYNVLTTIPHTIGYLHQLEDLILSFNDLKVVPSVICELKKVKNLELSRNPIKNLPNSLNQLLSLESLDVSWCALVQLPHSITKCKKLVTLNLANNVITRLPNQIGDLKNLTTLDVSHNKLRVFPYSLVNLTLVDLNVEGNPLQTKLYRRGSMGSRRRFPSLGEISASAASSAPWKMLQELPYNLREMLMQPTFCCHCGQRLFMQYESRIEFVHFREVGQKLPLHQIICSNGYCLSKT